jgi:hypothetical protein
MPAALRDSTWAEFLHDYQLFAECVSYEQLARDRQLGGDQDHLRTAQTKYALVLVDEAHNYRNPDAPARAAILRQLLMGSAATWCSCRRRPSITRCGTFTTSCGTS